MEEIIKKIDYIGLFVEGALKATCPQNPAMEAFLTIFKKLEKLKESVIELHECSEECGYCYEPESFDEPLPESNVLNLNPETEKKVTGLASMSIYELKLDPSISGLLLLKNIYTIGQLTSKTREELEAIKGLAERRINKIIKKLGEHGFKLKDSK